MATRRHGRPNPVWTMVLGLVTLVALVVGAGLILREPDQLPAADPRPPGVAERASDAPASSHAIGQLPPRTLSLGSIGIEAPIGVSTVPGGVLTPPEDVSTVGIWQDGAALDSAEGTTLLAGHVNMIGQGNGALFELALIQPGDIIHTSDDTGSPTAWRVSAVVERPKADGVEESVFSGPFGPRRLAVVTCGGDLNFANGIGDYENNIYLYADLLG